MERIYEHRFNTFKERYDFREKVINLCKEYNIFVYRTWGKEENGKYILFVEISENDGLKYNTVQFKAWNIKTEVRGK